MSQEPPDSDTTRLKDQDAKHDDLTYEEFMAAALPCLQVPIQALQQVRKYLPLDGGMESSLIAEEDVATVREMARLARETDWPGEVAAKATEIANSMELLCAGLDQLTLADSVWSIYRASGAVTKVWQRLYPFAHDDIHISSLFLNERIRADAAAHDLLLQSSRQDERNGILQIENPSNPERSSAVYVPETYDAAKAYPLLVTLHGGSGSGLTDYWKWLAEARCEGVIVLSPSSLGDTWDFAQPDPDIENIASLITQIKAEWKVDDSRLLLTGMSDGGTFSFIAGLMDDSPFTHLAPCSASFHPFLLEGSSRERLDRVKIYLVHGARDHMFPIYVAQEAYAAFLNVGVDVVYKEIEDLGHAYDESQNAAMLEWYLQNDTATDD